MGRGETGGAEHEAERCGRSRGAAEKPPRRDHDKKIGTALLLLVKFSPGQLDAFLRRADYCLRSLTDWLYSRFFAFLFLQVLGHTCDCILHFFPTPWDRFCDPLTSRLRGSISLPSQIERAFPRTNPPVSKPPPPLSVRLSWFLCLFRSLQGQAFRFGIRAPPVRVLPEARVLASPSGDRYVACRLKRLSVTGAADQPRRSAPSLPAKKRLKARRARPTLLRFSRGVLAQLVRAPPCHGGGCGFEPRRLRETS